MYYVSVDPWFEHHREKKNYTGATYPLIFQDSIAPQYRPQTLQFRPDTAAPPGAIQGITIAQSDREASTFAGS